MSEGPQETALDNLLAYAEGYAEFSMRKLGRVPPSLLAISPNGSFHFIPATLKDVRAKDTFANTARLICLAYGVTAAVIVLEAWMKTAKPGETLDTTEPPSEAFDRQEVVVITGEAIGQQKQKLLPIIRTDAGGFFGFGEHSGPKFDAGGWQKRRGEGKSRNRFGRSIHHALDSWTWAECTGGRPQFV